MGLLFTAVASAILRRGKETAAVAVEVTTRSPPRSKISRATYGEYPPQPRPYSIENGFYGFSQYRIARPGRHLGDQLVHDTLFHPASGDPGSTAS